MNNRNKLLARWKYNAQQYLLVVFVLLLLMFSKGKDYVEFREFISSISLVEAAGFICFMVLINILLEAVAPIKRQRKLCILYPDRLETKKYQSRKAVFDQEAEDSIEFRKIESLTLVQNLIEKIFKRFSVEIFYREDGSMKLLILGGLTREEGTNLVNKVTAGQLGSLKVSSEGLLIINRGVRYDGSVEVPRLEIYTAMVIYAMVFAVILYLLTS